MGLDGRKKKAARELADAGAIYGSITDFAKLLGIAWTYETYIGLWLNESRIRTQLAVAVCHGVGYANSSDDWPLEVFDATAASIEEAKQVCFEVNAQRQFRMALREHGG